MPQRKKEKKWLWAVRFVSCSRIPRKQKHLILSKFCAFVYFKGRPAGYKGEEQKAPKIPPPPGNQHPQDAVQDQNRNHDKGNQLEQHSRQTQQIAKFKLSPTCIIWRPWLSPFSFFFLKDRAPIYSLIFNGSNLIMIWWQQLLFFIKSDLELGLMSVKLRQMPNKCSEEIG